MKKLFHLVVLLITFLAGTNVVIAQVSIAPTNLFIDSNSRFGTYMVINNSDQAQEISINFFFGYSELDENGKRSTVADDSLLAEEYSIVEYIRAFPQNFILQPNQRQVVRLRISPPNDLPDQTYWARIKTSSTPESPPIEIESNQAVAARVGISIEQVTGLFFKKGSVSTGIEIDEIRVQNSENEKIAVLTDFKRTGNSPFLGSVITSLVSNNGEIIKEGSASTSFYFDGTHRQELDITDVSPGEYTIRIHFDAQRSDVPSSDIIQMQPVTATTTVTIP